MGGAAIRSAGFILTLKIMFTLVNTRARNDLNHFQIAELAFFLKGSICLSFDDVICLILHLKYRKYF